MKVAKVLFLVGYVVASTVISCAQQGDDKEETATIYGQVLDPNGNPLEGLHVYIRSYDTKEVYIKELGTNIHTYAYATETYTDKQGRYKFEKVTITPSKRYSITISNPKDPLGEEKQILTPDKYALQGGGHYISQDIVLEDKEYKKEVNFNLTKPVIIKGKVTFEDGNPVKNLEIGVESIYGTSAETDENGNYIIKGIKPDENGKINIIHSFPGMEENVIINIKPEQDFKVILGIYQFIIFYEIPVKEGEITVKDITIRKPIDASKISIRYQVFVNNLLCTAEAIQPSSEIYELGFIVGGLYIIIRNQHIGYLYEYLPPLHGKAEMWDIPPGKYMLEIEYEDPKVSTQAEIEIKENKTLELEIYVTMKDKKLEKIEVKLKE